MSEERLDLCGAEGSSRLKTLAGESWFEVVSAPNVANRSESDSSEPKREAAASTPFMSKLCKDSVLGLASMETRRPYLLRFVLAFATRHSR